ncbi:MAG: hypothetical protein JSY10_11290 [Paenibacillus sp.]|nr:hypothetical protein [Paenibacillus sp.]
MADVDRVGVGRTRDVNANARAGSRAEVRDSFLQTGLRPIVTIEDLRLRAEACGMH